MWRANSAICVLGVIVGSTRVFAGADGPAPVASANDLRGKFTSPCRRPGFASVEVGKCLRREAATRFREMAKTALKEEKIRLWVVSATRTFADQKAIWERKWRAEKRTANARDRALRILEWSAMPGTSRHHFGTDVDIGHPNCGGDCLVNPAWSTGKGLAAYLWLEQNASRFGFCQPYRGVPSERSGGNLARGYLEERWHWSYRPIASRLLARYVELMKSLRPAKGDFSGAAVGAEFYESFVRNIDPSCTP